MTPLQAIQILDQVTALAQINRVDQTNTQTALSLLRQFVLNNSPKESPAEQTEPAKTTPKPKPSKTQ